MMADEKMARWEDKMTAGERRILMNNFVFKALIHLMAKEQDYLRISAFERTGCFITMLVNSQKCAVIEKTQAMMRRSRLKVNMKKLLL